jgi:hypothetical protein
VQKPTLLPLRVPIERPALRVLSVLLVLIASPLFLSLAVWQRMKKLSAPPTEFVIISPLPGRDGQ